MTSLPKPADLPTHEIAESRPNLIGKQPQALGDARWDWSAVKRLLVVRLRSIGDTVLSTPSLFALRRFLPNAEIDILLEDWVAPLLDGFEYTDSVLTIKRGSLKERLRAARALRSRQYDVAYNLHGGSTATLLMWAAGARNRVGFESYRYGSLLNHRAPSSSDLWKAAKTHSAEQQLALVGWTGVPVSDRPWSHLAVTAEALSSVREKLSAAGIASRQPIALIHPAAAFDTKRWAIANFAEVVRYLSERGIATVAISGLAESGLLDSLKSESLTPVVCISDLTLPEVTALASISRVFVGNDSGIAHMAAAVDTPSVVIFGSSNVYHWRPWTRAASEVVRHEMPCAPCPGYTCAEFDEPRCIREVSVDEVISAVDRILAAQFER